MGNATEKPVAVEPVAVEPVPEKPVRPFTVETVGTDAERATIITVGNGTGPALALAGGVTVEAKRASDGTPVLFLDAGETGIFILAENAGKLADGDPRSGTKSVKAALSRVALDPAWSAFIDALAVGQSADGSSVEIRLAGASAVTRDRAREILEKRFAPKA